MSQRRDRQFWGPDRGGACPCGSNRPVLLCHGRDDGSWRARWWTPGKTVSTGYTHPGCFAGPLHDCSTQLSHEHWVAKAVRDVVDRRPLLTTLGSRVGDQGGLGVHGVISPVLCQRHQTVLAPLDQEASKALTALQRYSAALDSSHHVSGDDFDLASGPLLEAWVLKTLFGLLAAPLSAEAGGRSSVWRPGAEAVLLDVLFNGAAWPLSWGLWLTGVGRSLAAAIDPAIGTFVSSGTTWGAAAEFGPFPLQLLLGAPDDPGATYRPGGLVVLTERVDIQTMLAIGWPDRVGGPPVISKRLDSAHHVAGGQ